MAHSTPSAGEPLRIAVLLFPDVELLDFAGPLEVFTVARDEGDRPLFDVRTLSPAAGSFRTRHGLLIGADAPIAESPRLDLLVVPGGFGVRALLDDAATIEFIRRSRADGAVVASVCTGAWLLAKAGLLDGRPATTHHLCLDRLRELAPRCVVRPDQRVVDTGDVLTSGGISSGIDMALHLVRRLHSLEAARRTARYMEYPWLAPPAVLQEPAAESTKVGPR